MRYRSFTTGKGRIDGIVALGDGVLAYWQKETKIMRLGCPVYGGRYLGIDGQNSAASYRYTYKKPEPPESLATIGGHLYRFAGYPDGADHSDDGGVYNRGVEAVWGGRYANVRFVGPLVPRPILPGSTPAIVIVHGESWSPRFERHVSARTQFDWGVKRGLLWSLPANRNPLPGSAVQPVSAEWRLGQLIDLHDPMTAGPVPGNLVAVSPGNHGFYRLNRSGGIQHWDVARPDGDRLVLGGGLDKPHDLRHAAPTDLAVSPDGRRLFAAWAGKGVDNEWRGCVTSIYDAATFALVAHYTFPADRVAPSPDGLSLWTTATVGGVTTLTQIDLDD